MNIYLIRHGDAEKVSIGKRDFDRELTASGKIKLKSAVLSWKNLVKKFDYIITSPLTRAVQTANVIADLYGAGDRILIDKKLSPGSRTESLIEIANSLNGEDIAFVGHQPDLSEALSDLISPKGSYTDFKKGAIAKVSFGNKAGNAKGTLEFLIPLSAFNSHS